MRCDLNNNPLEEDCLLNKGFALSQESLKSELVEFGALSHLLHPFRACIAFIEVKELVCWVLTLGVG